MATPDSFFEQVYEAVKLIPYGRVSTYGHIARLIGSPQAARMVGWALNASHSLTDVPAHRVVNRKGMLSGQHHFGGPGIMQSLLESEGIEVENNRVKAFESLVWDPFKP